MKPYSITPELKHVSETLLVPLFYRAKETLENGMIRDDAAIDIVRKIDYNFQKITDDKDTQKVIAIRTKFIDRIVTDYIATNENPVIVNLGAGLDTRHLKFSDHIKWYQLDLEKAMSLRYLFFQNGHKNISKSILDFSWMDDIAEKENVLFIIEGVLMYLDETQVKSIFKALASKFRNSHIVFDTISPSFVNLKEHKSIDMEQAPFKWGNRDSAEIETWGYGFSKIKDYHYVSDETQDKIINFLQDTGFKVSKMKIN